MLNKIKKNNSGFTLIEIMVTISILIVLVYIGMDYLVLGFKAARYADEQSEAVDVARTAMAQITKEIRGANTSEQGDYPLNQINDDDFIFFSDIDDDDIFEKVRYFLASSTLYRVVTEPGALNDYQIAGSTTTAATYMNNVDDSIFLFYDESYTETAVINEVRLIKTVLKINVTPTIAPNDVFVESDVNLRNLKDNL